MKTKAISTLLILISLLLACCAPATPSLPNPASVFCEEQGGTLEIRTGDDGSQAGYCIFSDGSECEEWAFFRDECEPAESQIGMPNPASVFCEEQGGTLEIRTGDDGGQAGYCIFPDGSECEEWAFFRGECEPAESQIGMANPASVFCEEQGGTPEIRTGDDGRQAGYCIFPDGSECEEWAFFRGECEPAESQIGMANPASVFCEEQGGTLEIRTGDDGGQAGYCIFPDGSECEEWAFFRGECEPSEPDDSQIGMPNPASVFCEEQGGTLEIRTGDDGSQAGYCIFPDGSECEEWAFFRGECEPSEPSESQIGMANPASVFCEEQGGTLEIRTGDDGSQAGYCIFPDGSGCEEWALFHGKCAPKSDYQPLSATACSALADAVAGALDVEVVTEQAVFEDYIGGETGFGCQATATGTGLDFESFPAVADALKGMLEARGWQADMQYAADGPTGTGAGFHQANGLCLLRVGWEPSEDADCPEDLPISACDLAPEQQLYTIVLHCAQDISTGQ